ncbi:MAG: acyl-CoA dehydrogenase family protein [Terricaulis sp.]
MALSLSPDQEHIRSEARRFLKDAFRSDVQRELLHQRGQYDAAFWQSCIDMGWTAAGVPEQFGGLGLGALDVCLIAEECGRVIAAAPFLAANYAAAFALLDHGDDTQREALLPGIAAGKVRFALAFLETEDGLAEKPSTTLRAGKLTGDKIAAAGAAAATHALVHTSAGIAIVDLASPGVTRETGDTIDNTRCSAALRFDNTPAQTLSASADALHLLAIQAAISAFEQIGGAETTMQMAREYACTREAFGQLIGKFQAIKHRIAEMFVAIELARGNALLAATGLAEGAPDFVARAGAARLTASDAFEFSAANSIQTHGAIGATWEHDLHLYLRRARALAVELGSPLFWEDVVVDALQGANT